MISSSKRYKGKGFDQKSVSQFQVTRISYRYDDLYRTLGVCKVLQRCLKRAAIFNAAIHQPMTKREIIHLTPKVDSGLDFRDRDNPIP